MEVAQATPPPTLQTKVDGDKSEGGKSSPEGAKAEPKKKSHKKKPESELKIRPKKPAPDGALFTIRQYTYNALIILRWMNTNFNNQLLKEEWERGKKKTTSSRKSVPLEEKRPTQAGDASMEAVAAHLDGTQFKIA